jgi:hypothetical protein
MTTKKDMEESGACELCAPLRKKHGKEVTDEDCKKCIARCDSEFKHELD